MARVLILLCVLFGLSSANAMPELKGEPILWVNGNISQMNTSDGAVFDEALLQTLKIESIQTNNHVVDQVVEYRGPTLSSLLDFVGAKGSQIKVIAWDDYAVTISKNDIEKYGVLLATHEAGIKMTIDDKGPLFVVFPFHEHPELKHDLYYSLSVWQVREIIVE